MRDWVRLGVTDVPLRRSTKERLLPKIAKNDTQSCTLSPKAHDCVSLTAIMTRPHSAPRDNNTQNAKPSPPPPVTIRPVREAWVIRRGRPAWRTRRRKTLAASFTRTVSRAGDPELVNDGPSTPPSKRGARGWEDVTAASTDVSWATWAAHAATARGILTGNFSARRGRPDG
jgi:hypothetical protein